ncbi:MAG: hypothetical protein AB2L07_00770 [Thermoanaerobaculaceae bacterium]
MIEKPPEGALVRARHAVRVFTCYEDTYRKVQGEGLEYLASCSASYKEVLGRLQDLIQPAVASTCPTCPESCCRVWAPDRRIDLSSSVGGFQLADYLLARHGATLPSPVLENLEANLCPFLANGCSLPREARSYCCAQWFCKRLGTHLEMEAVRALVAQLKQIVSTFSVSRCLALSQMQRHEDR